jgi:hypothetical protein
MILRGYGVMSMISKRDQQLAKRDVEGPAKFIAKTYRWQSGTALLVALGITSTAAVSILLATSAMAGQEPYTVGQLSQSRVIVPAGTTIPVRYDEAEKIIVTSKETAPVTLTVARNIRRPSSGEILIPVESQVRGQLRPVSGGSQFFAQEVIFSNSGQRLPIDAISEIIAPIATVTQKTKPSILQDAAIGAGAGAVLGAIFGGRVRLGEVLGGAGIGAGVSALQGGQQKETKLVEIDPDTDLHLFLRTDLVLRRR